MNPKPLILCLMLGTAVACGGGGSNPDTGMEAGPKDGAVDAGPKDCSAADSGCPNDLPTTCPMPEPSFSQDVQPIINARCTTCHGPNGVQSGRAFTSYDRIVTYKSAMLNQLFACRMPPAGAPQPTAGERATVLTWLVCGAKNN